MKLFRKKNLNLGFVILCPDRHISLLRATCNSIRTRSEAPFVVAVSDDFSPEDVAEAERFCPVRRAGGTITSLVNAGMSEPPGEWNMTVMAGTRVRPRIEERYSLFVESQRDVLYAIVDGHYEFMDCSLNGIMVHRDTWSLVGDLCPTNPLPICKLVWAMDAIRKGCRLKAISGARMI